MNTYRIKIFYHTQRNNESMIFGNIKAPNYETAERIAIGSLMQVEMERKDRYLKIDHTMRLRED